MEKKNIVMMYNWSIVPLSKQICNKITNKDIHKTKWLLIHRGLIVHFWLIKCKHILNLKKTTFFQYERWINLYSDKFVLICFRSFRGEIFVKVNGKQWWMTDTKYSSGESLTENKLKFSLKILLVKGELHTRYL